MITHPEKVLFPQDGITKGGLASYYETIAPLMLPHLCGRPVTMERYHRGIGEKGFFQKDVSKGFPEWLVRVEVPKKGGTVHHPVVCDARSLLWLVNQNSITPHVWTSRVPNLYQPDICVFDLDPSEDQPEWRIARNNCCRPVVPLDGENGFGDVSRFAHVAGTLLVKRDPGHLTQEFSKADRGGRILVDTGRNAYSATFAAAYAVRAKHGAPVSAPCTWDELEGGEAGPQTWTLRNMAARIAEAGDLWSEMPNCRQPLRAAIEKLRRM